MSTKNFFHLFACFFAFVVGATGSIWMQLAVSVKFSLQNNFPVSIIALEGN